MHEMLTVHTDVCGVCLSVTWLKLAVVRAVYAMCHVYGVNWCSLCQITLTTCYQLSQTELMVSQEVKRLSISHCQQQQIIPLTVICTVEPSRA